MGIISNILDELMGYTKPYDFNLPIYGNKYVVIDVIKHNSDDNNSASWGRFSVGDQCFICARDLISDDNPLVKERIPKSKRAFIIFNKTKSLRFGSNYFKFYSSYGLTIKTKKRKLPASLINYVREQMVNTGISINTKMIDVIDTEEWVFDIESDGSIKIISDTVRDGNTGIVLKYIEKCNPSDYFG